MRKLGKGQTLSFCVPQEIRTKVQTCTSTAIVRPLSIADIIQWTILETFADSRKCMPLWATQGKRHLEHKKLWDAARDKGKTVLTKEASERFLEDEAQSLAMRYQPRTSHGTETLFTHSETTSTELKPILDRCHAFSDLDFRSSTLQEEQERELSPEIEQERQVQRPAPATPGTHSLHDNVVKFWKTGKLQRTSKPFLPAWSTLRSTGAAGDFDVEQLDRGDGLLVTADFARTVAQTRAGYLSDAY